MAALVRTIAPIPLGGICLHRHLWRRWVPPQSENSQKRYATAIRGADSSERSLRTSPSPHRECSYKQCYDTLQSVKDMQEFGRACFLSGIRIERKDRPNFPEFRLIAGLCETYGFSTAPKSSVGNPRIEELAIHK